MKALKQRIEDRFAYLGEISYDHPWWFITISIVLVLFFSWQLQYAVIDTTTEGFLKKDDPALITYNAFKREFGRDERFIISLESDEIFSRDFLTRYIAMHKRFEQQVPYLDEVESLHNVRDIYGEDDELVVEDFLPDVTDDMDAAKLAELKQRAMQHPLYVNSYLSADGTVANIFLRPAVFYAHTNPKTGQVEYLGLGDAQIHEMYEAVMQVVDEFPELKRHMHIAGMPAVTEELNLYLVGDMLKFIGIALAVIAAVLYILFRRLVSVFLPLLVMVTALLSTMGLMSLFKQPIQMPTVILPSFILSVGVGDSIHLLTLFFRKLKFGLDKRTALAEALAHTGLPMFFTSATTAASLCSFGRSEILPVANLGLFAAAGVSFAFIYTIVILPALLAVVPTRVRSTLGDTDSKPKKATWFDHFLDFSIHFSSHHSGKIVVGGLLIMAVSLYSALQLGFSHDPVKWLPESSAGRQAVEFIGDKIGGSVPVEILLDTGRVDGVKDAEFMQSLDAFVADMQGYQQGLVKVGNVVAVNQLLKETNKALFDNADEAYRIPDNRELIAQEFIMLETSGAKDLFRLVDQNYQKARVTILTRWIDALYFGDFIRDMEDRVAERFDGHAKVTITGILPMLARTLRHIMTATSSSYLIAFVVISLMMVLLLGSFKYGLVSMLPNLLPITLALGLMNITGAPLDMFSILIGSIAIGLSVDDTVHFMHGFRRVYEKTGDALRAVDETLHSSGRAMLSTSIVLSLGFLIYMFSVMNNLKDFGFYTALCIVVALLADFWMAPALVLLMTRNRKQVQHGG